ncbi:MAG: UDP-N-acetylglucosamine 2-epimerase (hydrolyzing) [Bacteroidales bacterium]|nr:UDP-N-acetylglucosamine 2-epimerase (hydrolyzing) [Bacteroidales bacterium]
MRKICFITGTRAEYGLLSRLMKMVQDDADTQLQIIATNMHLSPKYGNTYQEIENDGFTIDKKIPILEEGKDNSNATIKSMAKALAGFADAYDELKPDMVVVLGDRYEILAATTAALIERIPIAHLYGGEITEGAYDDAIRHSVTKMSHLHFTSCEEYRHRVIQLGEQPDHVFNVGSIGVENIKMLPLMSKDEIEKEIGFAIDDHTILVTYHPVTLGNRTAKEDIDDFIAALDEKKNLRIIFTMPNSDTGGQAIVEAINAFVDKNHQRAKAFKSLGVLRYLSVMQQVAAVVGNSSSGLVEVPSFGIPTLNIGDRQKGRMAADSVYNCETDKQSVLKGLDIVLSEEFRQKAAAIHNPYDKEGTAQAMFNVIRTYPLDSLNQKHFYDIKL